MFCILHFDDSVKVRMDGPSTPPRHLLVLAPAAWAVGCPTTMDRRRDSGKAARLWVCGCIAWWCRLRWRVGRLVATAFPLADGRARTHPTRLQSCWSRCDHPHCDPSRPRHANQQTVERRGWGQRARWHGCGECPRQPLPVVPEPVERWSSPPPLARTHQSL
jgi:hypothetical protein